MNCDSTCHFAFGKCIIRYVNSYYCEFVGHISESTIRKYISDQKGK